jgi:integrase
VRRRDGESSGFERFTADIAGFERFRRRHSGRGLSESSWRKWKPILSALEAVREELFGAQAWRKLTPAQIALDVVETLLERCTSRDGGAPSSNTLRGRFDACQAYFDFLVTIGELGQNPLRDDNLARRPSSKPNDRPHLEPSDGRLAEAPKFGHELAIYALARGAALRAGEIAALEDSDVDFADDLIHIRTGKTKAAIRAVPMLPETKFLLQQYRSWRDTAISSTSTRFVRTASGAISEGYIWKLTKAMAARANLRPLKGGAGGATRVTPHTLRRTFVSDLANRGVPIITLSEVVGHASTRVTEESYAIASRENRARQVLLANGLGPFSAAHAVEGLERELAAAQQLANDTPEAVLIRLRRLQQASAELERSVLRAAPELAKQRRRAA